MVARASALYLVDLGFIPLAESQQKTLKMVSKASLLGALHLGKVVKNKPASSLVLSGKALKWDAPTFMWKTSDLDTTEMVILK